MRGIHRGPQVQVWEYESSKIVKYLVIEQTECLEVVTCVSFWLKESMHNLLCLSIAGSELVLKTCNLGFIFAMTVVKLAKAWRRKMSLVPV